MSKVFTAHELRRALKEAGLPSSRTLLWQLEKENIIPRPARYLEFETREPTRIYNQGEIDKIINIIRKRNK